CLASPAVATWWGYAGPDAFGVSLALAAALMVLYERPVLAGALAGAAATTRPELWLPVFAITAGGLATPRHRDATLRAATGTLAARSIVLLAVRPPIAAPPIELVGLGAVAAGATAVVVASAERWWALPITAAVAAPAIGTSPAAIAWMRTEWPEVVLATAAIVLGIRSREHRRLLAPIVAVIASLALVYHVKNGGLERYLALLVPLVCVAAGIGIALLPRIRASAIVAGATALAVALLAGRPATGHDAFALLAPKLTDDPSLPLVTAAPDAYGYLLPRRTVVAMRP